MPRTRRSTRLFAGAAALLAVGALAACSSSSTPGGSDSSTPAPASSSASGPDLSGVTLRVGVFQGVGWEASLDAAGEDDTPYTVEYSNFAGGNLMLEAIAANAIDLASASEIPPIFASQAQGGGNFEVVATQKSTTLQQEVVALPDSGITDIKGLKGKRVAYVQATTAQYFLARLLEDAGLKWTDITPVPLLPADGTTALLSGDVDALASYGQSIITAEAQGAVEIGSGKDILSGNFLLVGNKTTIADPDTAAAIADYFERLQISYDWATDNPEKWAAIVAEATKQPEEQALKTFVDGNAQQPNRLGPTTPEAIASEQDVADTFTTLGLLPSKIDVSTFWTDQFNPALEALTSTTD